jgi:CheY-like chemotaxis protein
MTDENARTYPLVNPGGNKRVLVIDDVCIILDVIGIMLQMEGYEVVTATDVPTALERVEKTCPDLILLDMMMPNMSGYQFIQLFRQHNPQNVCIPIILLTVKLYTEDEIERLGVAGYLRKPFHRKELIDKLNELLSDPNESAFFRRARVSG